MTTLLDNKGQGKVGDALAEGIQANARLSILSGLFSIYGYSVLKKQLARVGGLRLLIPSNDTPAGSGSERPFRMVTHEYPPAAVREAIINAVVHADYSIGGMNIKVAIFNDRIEVTNPGMLPFGITLEAALSGVSKLRNRVIGRVFRELGLIEQWGSGMGRMITACQEAGLQSPRFEEIGNSFRVALRYFFAIKQIGLQVQIETSPIQCKMAKQGKYSIN
jgi:predicted HTH transcriptional regulator